MPTAHLILNQNEIGDNYLTTYLKVVKHEKLSRTGSLCEEKLDYNFTDCVKRSVSNEAGCKLPWDKTTTGSIVFLAVQNSSIGDLVTHSLTDSLTHSLTDSLTHGTFTFDIQRATLET